MLVCISGSGCVNARRILSRAVLHHRQQESLLGETMSATPPCTCSLKFQLSIVLVCCLDDVVVMSQTKFVGKVHTAMAISGDLHCCANLAYKLEDDHKVEVDNLKGKRETWLQLLMWRGRSLRKSSPRSRHCHRKRYCPRLFQRAILLLLLRF